MINGKSVIPVWEDTYYEYSGSTLHCRVKKDGVKVCDIYAEAFPDGRPIKVYVNRLAKDYLSNGGFNPTATGLTADSEATAVFSLIRLIESGGTYTEDVTLGDITIVYGFGNLSEGLVSEPVNGHADVRMNLPLSVFFLAGTNITIE